LEGPGYTDITSRLRIRRDPRCVENAELFPDSGYLERQILRPMISTAEDDDCLSRRPAGLHYFAWDKLRQARGKEGDRILKHGWETLM
jgi:hypothetical protein